MPSSILGTEKVNDFFTAFGVTRDDEETAIDALSEGFFENLE